MNSRNVNTPTPLLHELPCTSHQPLTTFYVVSCDVTRSVGPESGSMLAKHMGWR